MNMSKEDEKVSIPRRHSFSEKSTGDGNETDRRRIQSFTPSSGKSRRVLYRAKSKLRMMYVTLSSTEKTPTQGSIQDFDIDVTDGWIKPCTSEQSEKSYQVFFNLTESQQIFEEEIIIKEKGKIIQKFQVKDLVDNEGVKTLDYLQIKLTASPPEWKLPDLRIYDDKILLCEKELKFLKTRKPFVQSTLNKFLDDTDNLEKTDIIPHIALMGSGGGYRAMVAMSGIMNALYDTTLLDCILYTAVLSGSSWYIASLYSHPEWPNINPEIVQNEIKEKIAINPITCQNVMFYLMDFANKKIKSKPWDFTTHIFGPLLGAFLLPNRMECRWSQVANKLSEGTVPLPLLCAINAKASESAKTFHAICGSAFTITYDEYISRGCGEFQKAFSVTNATKDCDVEIDCYKQAIQNNVPTVNYDNEIEKEMESMFDQFCNITEEYEHLTTESENDHSDRELKNTSVDDDVCRKTSASCPSKEGELDDDIEIDGFFDGVKQAAVNIFKPLVKTRWSRAASVNNFLRQISFQEWPWLSKTNLGPIRQDCNCPSHRCWFRDRDESVTVKPTSANTNYPNATDTCNCKEKTHREKSNTSTQ